MARQERERKSRPDLLQEQKLKEREITIFARIVHWMWRRVRRVLFPLIVAFAYPFFVQDTWILNLITLQDIQEKNIPCFG